jgi:LmbE family N-acetylglucosaminyl deacetylase
MATVAFVHAHPDDEALFTAGTMRGLFERGHRVILIVATDGGVGLTSESFADNLAAVRLQELNHSAALLGVSKVYNLGYADSGLDGNTGTSNFVNTPLDEIVTSLSDIFNQEQPDVVVGYDKHGGYGHPDHVKVHHATTLAAQNCAIPTLLEATMDRQSIARMIDWIRPLLTWFKVDDVLKLADGFTARADIGYVIDIQRWISPKRASLKAHASQAVGGSTPRTVAMLLKIPRPIFAKFLAREWYHIVWKSSERNAFDDLTH